MHTLFWLLISVKLDHFCLFEAREGCDGCAEMVFKCRLNAAVGLTVKTRLLSLHIGAYYRVMCCKPQVSKTGYDSFESVLYSIYIFFF